MTNISTLTDHVWYSTSPIPGDFGVADVEAVAVSVDSLVEVAAVCGSFPVVVAEVAVK